MKKILLVNPWIYDFAAYDFGMKPVGLLRIGEYLRRNGDEVRLLDCLSGPRKSRHSSGFAKMNKVKVDKPAGFDKITRPYFRYGIKTEEFEALALSYGKSDVIYMTSGMTYWYPGVFEAIKLLNKIMPKKPVVLGGVYPTLCYDHAKEHSGADIIWKGNYIKEFFKDNFYPAYDLLDSKEILPIQLTEGCPYRCSYCASHVMKPRFVMRDPVDLFEEVMHYNTSFGTKTFVFYDDALSYSSSRGIKKFLRLVIACERELLFHTPNGMHAKYIDDELAYLLRKANFRDLRLSLETADENLQQFTGGKVTNKELRTSIRNLKEAGFEKSDIGVYIIIGAPWLSIDRSMQDVMFVNSLGVKAILASYSPIPGTADYNTILKAGIVNKDTDPLWHNKSIFSELLSPTSLDEIQVIRRLTAKLNKS